MDQIINKQTGTNVLRSAAFGALTWILPLCLGFIATPIIVRSLGNIDYGIYALILGFISYSFTFNFGRAVTKYIAEYRLKGDSQTIRDVISASFFLNILTGLFGVVLICLIASWLVRDVFNIEAAAQQRTVAAIYIAAVVIFLWMLSQGFTSVLQGIHRFDVYSKIYTANMITLTLGNILIVVTGYGLLALLAWNAVVLFVFSLIFGFAAKRLLPEFGIRFTFRSETLRMILRYSGAVVATQILANALLLFERAWITQRLGSESLTFYVVPMSLGLYLHGFTASLMQVVFPLASEMKDDKERLLRMYTKATKAVCVLVSFAVATVVVQGSLFLHLWMGESFAQTSASLLILHVICFSLVSVMTISWQMTEGLGLPLFNAAATGVCTMIGISLMFAFTNELGNYGVALARLSGFGVIFSSIFIAEYIFFKKIQIHFWMTLAGSLILAGTAAAGVEYLISSILPSTWAGLLIAVSAGALVYCLFLWFLKIVTDDDKMLIRRMLRN